MWKITQTHQIRVLNLESYEFGLQKNDIEVSKFGRYIFFFAYIFLAKVQIRNGHVKCTYFLEGMTEICHTDRDEWVRFNQRYQIYAIVIGPYQIDDELTNLR